MITTSPSKQDSATVAPASHSDSQTSAQGARALAYHRVFVKVCEQLNFNEKERQWFRALLAEELGNH
jgi:hypothetical protein